MDDQPILPVDDMEPSVPLMDTGAPPTDSAPLHPSGLNRAQRRAAYERHKAADRQRRMAAQARQRRRSR